MIFLVQQFSSPTKHNNQFHKNYLNLEFEICLSLVGKTDSGMLNNTYLNNFHKVLKIEFEKKNLEI